MRATNFNCRNPRPAPLLSTAVNTSYSYSLSRKDDNLQTSLRTPVIASQSLPTSFAICQPMISSG